MVDRLERIVVQLVEAGRLMDAGDDSHQRLALLLLDNLAEILMHYECEWHLMLAEHSRRALKSFEDRLLDDEGRHLRDEIAQSSVSKSQARRIRWAFGEKVEFLIGRQVLDSDHGRVLTKLHQYRNDAYHRDQFRSETLDTAVGIYYYLCCQLMITLRPHMMRLGRTPKSLEPFVGADAHIGLDSRELIAEKLLTQRHLGDASVARLLREHALDRLSGMRETLHTWAGPQLSGNELSPEDLLHLCQVPDDAVKTMEDLLKIDEVPVPHDFASIERWEERASAIDDETPLIDAMVAFADLEDEFEPLERRIDEMTSEMDRAIQLEIDLRRGK